MRRVKIGHIVRIPEGRAIPAGRYRVARVVQAAGAFGHHGWKAALNEDGTLYALVLYKGNKRTFKVL